MKLVTIILAAGRGERMRAGLNKAFLLLNGRPLLEHALEMWRPFSQAMIVAAAEADWQQAEQICAPYGSAVKLALGGASRAASLKHALAALPAEAELVAVHDAARPLTSAADIAAVIAAARRQGAAILAAPVTDTIRWQEEVTGVKQEEGEAFFCGELLPREQLLAAQTPQIFRRDWLCTAYANATDAELAATTDDAALLQAQGRACAFVWAQEPNIKITKPEDMIIAEALLHARRHRL